MDFGKCVSKAKEILFEKNEVVEEQSNTKRTPPPLPGNREHFMRQMKPIKLNYCTHIQFDLFHCIQFDFSSVCFIHCYFHGKLTQAHDDILFIYNKFVETNIFSNILLVCVRLLYCTAYVYYVPRDRSIDRWKSFASAVCSHTKIATDKKWISAYLSEQMNGKHSRRAPSAISSRQCICDNKHFLFRAIVTLIRLPRVNFIVSRSITSSSFSLTLEMYYYSIFKQRNCANFFRLSFWFLIGYTHTHIGTIVIKKWNNLSFILLRLVLAHTNKKRFHSINALTMAMTTAIMMTMTCATYYLL